MPKLSKNNLYAIQWLHSQGKSIEDIATELKVSVTQVKNAIPEQQTIQQAEPSIPNNSAVKPDPKSLMITQTSGKGTNSVAIMTKQASELGDALKKNHTPPRTVTGIFRPREK